MATETIVKIDERAIKLTNLQKLLWPTITKADLINYYYQMANFILPHTKNRPLTVTRYPHGINEDFFYQKQFPAYAPEWIYTVKVSSEEKDVDYILANDRATLIWLANQACIELHPWLSTQGELSRPDRIIVDLDPDPPSGFPETRRVAQFVKDLLDQMGLRSFPKTSGATGIHIYIPILPKYTYRVTSQFVGFIGQLLAKHQPTLASNARLIKNREGKVYIDHLQNLQGKTIVAPYSPRPTPQGTVSAPFYWADLDVIHPHDFTIGMISSTNYSCPWKEIGAIRQDLDSLLPLIQNF